MTSKEYLHQAYRLDHKINSDIEELKRLRELSGSISSPQLGDRVQTSRSTDAPFVRSIEKIMLLEQRIDSEIDTLVDLKDQMREVIAAVQDTLGTFSAFGLAPAGNTALLEKLEKCKKGE